MNSPEKMWYTIDATEEAKMKKKKDGNGMFRFAIEKLLMWKKRGPKVVNHYGCQTEGKTEAVRLSALKYKEQDWMINLPLYAVCNL